MSAPSERTNAGQASKLKAYCTFPIPSGKIVDIALSQSERLDVFVEIRILQAGGTSSFEPIRQLRKLTSGKSSGGRADQRDDLAFVPAVNSEVFRIDCDDAVPGIELTHSYQAEIGEVGLPFFVSLRECGQLRQMIVAVEGESEQTLKNHFEHEANAAEMEGCFREDWLASQERLGHLLGDA